MYYFSKKGDVVVEIDGDAAYVRDVNGRYQVARLLVEEDEFVRRRPYLVPLSEDEIPTEEQIARWIDDGVCPAVIDGCEVEPDGRCPHGWPSWLVAMGVI